jgi:hypothetical protein
MADVAQTKDADHPLALVDHGQPADLERLHVPYRFGEVVVIPAAMDTWGHHGPTWYSSGDGEQLAVVETDGGLDPINGPLLKMATSEVTPVGQPVVAAGLGTAYPFDVQYDDKRFLWYSDVLFDVGDTYFPFKRLTLARYQPHALSPDMNFSSAVDAGMYQLPPKRQVKLTYQPLSGQQRNVGITVFGNAPSTIQLAHGSRGNLVEVSLEERTPGGGDASEDLAWSLAGSPAQQPVAAGLPGQADQLWAGNVVVPTSGAKQYRLVIKEFELFAANARDPQGQGWLGQPAAGTGPSRRLVYADTIPFEPPTT